MYYKGYGTRQDCFKSVRWWKLAAEQGYAKAQFNLGIIYANGNGVVQDNVIAQMWYNITCVNEIEKAN